MTARLVALLLLAIGIASGAVYLARYVVGAGCFNEAGRCFDEETGVVMLEQAGIGWLALAILSLGGFVVLVRRSRRP